MYGCDPTRWQEVRTPLRTYIAFEEHLVRCTLTVRPVLLAIEMANDRAARPHVGSQSTLDGPTHLEAQLGRRRREVRQCGGADEDFGQPRVNLLGCELRQGPDQGRLGVQGEALLHVPRAEVCVPEADPWPAVG